MAPGSRRRLSLLVMGTRCALAGVALCTLAAAAATGGSAAPKPAALCGYFSPNPDDDSGPPVLFYADLSADEESAITHSPGRGRADFSLDRKTLRLTWKLTYSALTAPVVAMGIYGPQTPGGEAGLVYDMLQNRRGDVVEGSTVLKDADVTYLIQDRYYVNITTKAYPSGEIRGPIRKQPPRC